LYERSALVGVKYILYFRCVFVNVLHCLIKDCTWSIALHGVETCDSSESGSEIAGMFDMWFWRREEKIIRTDRVRNEDVLQWRRRGIS
jgi:hypothetical protein